MIVKRDGIGAEITNTKEGRNADKKKKYISQRVEEDDRK